jgi:phage recombination protein Bet
VANEYNLNPFTREIYAFPAKSGGIVPVVGIDGWLRIINEHPSFDGLDVVISPDGAEGTCTIYRKDRTHPTIITEYFGEVKRNTDNWEDMPKRMLRHKTIIQCARVAFSFSGIKDDDEATEIAAEVISSRPLPKMPMEKVEVKPEEVPTLEEVISAPREPGADD